MDRTIALITKAQQGDKSSEETLINENMPLVHSCVKKFLRDSLEYDDLLQLGSIGLIKAIRRFDPKFEVMFSTYAVPLIMGEIRRFLRDDGIIKVSRSLKEINKKVCLAQGELMIKLGCEPTISQVAEYTQLDKEKIIMAMEACAPCESLHKKIYPESNSEIELADTITDSRTLCDEIEKIALKSALSNLDSRERKIIVLRYFKGKTQMEISKLVGVSQVQISRIEKRVLSSLKENLA